MSGSSAIVLVGPMGAGKTTVGGLLARELGLEAIDADAEVERRLGLTVAEIFARVGEPGFRRMEADVVVELLGGPPTILSLGGGAVTSADVRRALAGHRVVWLRAEPATLIERLGPEGVAHRPLLAEDPVGTLERLRDERDPYHRDVASLVVDVDQRTPGEVAAEILGQIR